ncbi:MAG: DUF2334 domain-containing protein [Opitutae bacterium]|nr:DUF2334 domain-containing protein [Opitutae bacterium]
MRYVILRDDDTNATTPAGCLEQLYRPFLARHLPVNLATIPHVRTDARRADGRPEEFVFGRPDPAKPRVWIGANRELVAYLQENSGYEIAQHGYDHSLDEFGSRDTRDLKRRLDKGAQLLAAAGFARPSAFVAPYDRFSAAALRLTAARFGVVSTGWFELRRLPLGWWPAYAGKKLAATAHWRIGATRLLSHPGCLLSRFRPRESMLENIRRTVAAQPLTVLVTHWWEYFPDGRPDEEFIAVLHRTAEFLAGEPDLRVIGFSDLARHAVPAR